MNGLAHSWWNVSVVHYSFPAVKHSVDILVDYYFYYLTLNIKVDTFVSHMYFDFKNHVICKSA